MIMVTATPPAGISSAGAPDNRNVLLSVRDVQKVYGSREAVTRALDDVSFDICEGEFVGVMGPSGSGKSTMLRCINRLEEPTGGQIFFEDTEITAKDTDINKVRAKVGMVFQNFNLFPHLTAKKNVMLAQTKVLKRSKEEAEKIAVEQLERVGLGERVDY